MPFNPFWQRWVKNGVMKLQSLEAEGLSIPMAELYPVPCLLSGSLFLAAGPVLIQSTQVPEHLYVAKALAHLSSTDLVPHCSALIL